MQGEIQEENDQKEASNLRKYELWEGAHIFYKNGWFMTGPKPKSLLIYFCLLNVTNLLSFGSTWIDWAHDESYYSPLIFGLIMWALCDITGYLASCSDPGLLPRMTQDNHCINHKFAFSDKNHLIVHGAKGQKNSIVKLKICGTCKFISMTFF
jgi:hypothetical protein